MSQSMYRAPDVSVIAFLPANGGLPTNTSKYAPTRLIGERPLLCA
ncbi:MAG: hypothetical protein ACLP1X_13540 [Polyangiaceae bacterium]